ncbi:early nodulin-like protein 14 [Curcuma longa]|uniref:early nodulin-like protein 14 n=1 Tax=Curcuma longa TaxID=136217 RepID=UPI003D9E41E5
MAALLSALVALAAMATVPPFAVAANYNVGGPGGSWDLSTDFTGWVSGKKFRVGDTLTFKHAANQHDVLEVSRAAYGTCATGNPISTDAGGDTVVKLTAAGKRYFICGISGHCSAGMKVEIDVLAAAPAVSPAASPLATKSSPPRSSLAAAPSSASRRSPTDATSAAGSSDESPPSKPTTTAVASGGEPAKAVAGFGSGLLMLAVLVL